MEQIHKRFTDKQVAALLKAYCQGILDRATTQEIPGISKTRFFALLNQYRLNLNNFSLAYRRETPARLPARGEKQIEEELILEKSLIDDPTLPITTYNYSAIRNRLAKQGKIERPYHWLQDRIVRTCAIEKLTTIGEVRDVLRDEVDRYNNHQVHSTTGEIPSIRFEKAKKEGNSLFRPFILPQPYTSAKDVFCLREKRMVNGYRRTSLFNHEIAAPHVPLREWVEVHLIPDVERGITEVRIWWEAQMVQSVVYPLKEFPGVHF